MSHINPCNSYKTLGKLSAGENQVTAQISFATRCLGENLSLPGRFFIVLFLDIFGIFQFWAMFCLKWTIVHAGIPLFYGAEWPRADTLKCTLGARSFHAGSLFSAV